MEQLSQELQVWKEHLERLQWAALIVDADLCLRWVSPECKAFIGTEDEGALGVGRNIIEAFLLDTWMGTVAPESQAEMFGGLGPSLLGALRERGVDPKTVVPEPLLPLLGEADADPIPLVWSQTFMYIDPRDRSLPSYPVHMGIFNLYDRSGRPVGVLAIFFMGVRPNLAALLGRGDQEMYERMARLVEPGPREGAILFCDLNRSVSLASTLATPRYFRMVRSLWTGIDAAVADETGIVGKHAGDGASAFFLVADVGSASGAASAAIRAGARIHEVASDVFGSVVEGACMKVGIHWGGSVYMGQLVPGGRLDVTALGDEVNEAARIQEAAGPGETLVSKRLVERLTMDDAAALGIDIEKIRYDRLAERPDAPPKAVRDAGGVAVTRIPG